MRFESEGGHLVADFVNSLDERLSPQPVERLRDYTDLVDFVHQEGCIDATETAGLQALASEPAAGQAHRDAIEFREALHRTLLARLAGDVPSDRDVVHLDRLVRQATNARRLWVTATDAGWHWREPLAPRRPLFELAIATGEFLQSADLDSVRQCAALDCGTLFLDQGKRRWCSMATCGNREKARRFRSAHRANQRKDSSR